MPGDENLRDREPIRATIKPDIPLMRYQADNIPDFDGNAKQLGRFIGVCENFISNFQNPNNPRDPINVCILDTILGKLKYRAADLIYSRSEINNWQSIKETLKITFSDQRSIDCLIQDLFSLKPFKNETPIQFGMRVQDARSLLHSKLNNDINNIHERTIKMQHYDEFALKTFINGLPYNMQLVVRLKNPDSLEKAIALVMEEENFIYLNSHNRITENPKPQYKPPITANLGKQPLSVPNYNPNMNQYRYPIFPPQYRQQIPYFRPPLPSFNFPRQTSYPSFRSTQNMQPFNSNRSFPNQNTNFQRNPNYNSYNPQRNNNANQVGEAMDTSSFRSRSTLAHPPQKRPRAEANFNQEIDNEKPGTSHYLNDNANGAYYFSNPEDCNYLSENLNNFPEYYYEYDPNTQYTTESFPNVNTYAENNYDLNANFNHISLNQNDDKPVMELNEQTENFQKTPNIPNIR